jgi:hypothetical protein
MARPIRIKGEVSHWLLNGDRFSKTTDRHQSAVRSALAQTGLPMVIIPHSALHQASIDLGSVRILEVTPDTYIEREIVETSMPSRAVWKYERRTVEGTGCYLHKTTGETVGYHGEWHQRIQTYWDSLGGETYEEYRARAQAARDEWEEVPIVSRNTGRRTLRVAENSGYEWELFDLDGQIAYRRTVGRHLLGQSLITARVWGRWNRPVRFLSGFDANETRPSYFFCELPRTSKASTVAEALVDLKPATVKAAEQMGRDVKRQGDIFAIPLPTLTRRDLTKQGARYEKGGHLFNTNHVATESATLADGTTLVRGTLRHDPQWRRPDHKRVTLGKTWHVALKNTVPVTA